ncbi:ATPase [Aphelenchoides avenae]|nr:ATPase [Aphelenchus avenae]
MLHSLFVSRIAAGRMQWTTTIRSYRGNRRRPATLVKTAITAKKYRNGRDHDQLAIPSSGSRNRLIEGALRSTEQRGFRLIPSLETDRRQPEPSPPPRIPTPREIVDYLDKFVIGQGVAKKTLAVGVYQHYQRLTYNLQLREQLDDASKSADEIIDMARAGARKRISADMPRNRLAASSDTLASELPLDKSNITLLGPSGVGKTYITQRLAQLLEVPFAMCDCTTLTQSGYVGDDADSVIQRLLKNADGDIEQAERGIVFLDEFDKIASSVDRYHSSNGLRDRGVQQALLKIVEGTTVSIKHPFIQGTKVDVDTGNILFVASGAFVNLERIVGRRLEQKALGFGASSSSIAEGLGAKDEGHAMRCRDEMLARAESVDLIAFGMLPEIVGRFPVIVPFHSLDEEMLLRVMCEPENSIIAQARKQFRLEGVQLNFTDDALRAIANEAFRRKTGVRALRSIVERVLLDAKFECPGSDIMEVIIDKSAVTGTGGNSFASKRTDEDKPKAA